MMHEAGVTNVVATLGTAPTVQHIRVLSRHAKREIWCICLTATRLVSAQPIGAGAIH